MLGAQLSMALETGPMGLLMMVFSSNSKNKTQNVFRLNTVAQSKESYNIHTNTLTVDVHISWVNTEMLKAVRKKKVLC